MDLSVFIPFVQRKIHHELKPADFVRIQGDFFVIDEVRRFRHDFTFTATETRDLVALTGSFKSRFRHIDKFAIDADLVATTVQLLYRQTDITGLQFGHLWTINNANLAVPDEVDVNSFSREDVIRAIVTTAEDEVILWFSGEEYTLVAFPNDGGPAEDGIPARFVTVVPYGFSRVMTKDEFEGAQISFRLRT